MAYSNGYKRDIDGSFKLDGRYIIPYDHFNKFKPTNRNTYEVYHGEIAPRYYADFAEKKSKTIKISYNCEYAFLYDPFLLI